MILSGRKHLKGDSFSQSVMSVCCAMGYLQYKRIHCLTALVFQQQIKTTHN